MRPSLRAAISKPFLLENNVCYLDFGEQELEEPAFLNELCTRSGCGLLLDLHNVYVNWRNGRADIERFLASLDLSRVVEVHLAGGLTYDGVYLDAHSGPVPEDLWLTRSIEQHLLVDCTKAVRLLDWHPNPGSGLARSVAWHLAHPPADASTDFSADDAALSGSPRPSGESPS